MLLLEQAAHNVIFWTGAGKTTTSCRGLNADYFQLHCKHAFSAHKALFHDGGESKLTETPHENMVEQTRSSVGLV